MRINGSDRKGFTLIELVIVISVITIIAAVVAPAAEKSMGTAADAVCLANRETLSSEILYAISADHEGTDPIRDNEIAAEVLAAHAGEELCPLGGTVYASVAYSGPVVFCTEHMREWSKGTQWKQGEFMFFDGLVFRCRVSHKSGSRSNTRNPTVKSNKGSWELVGTIDGSIPAYNSTVRFAEDYLCTYNGNIYQRTNYNLTGGQTPYSKSSSRYWILLGPVGA